MKVNDLSKLTGISSSKVRYYERCGIFNAQRNRENNYREFSELDAVNLYDALLNRSYDMAIDDLIMQQTMNLSNMNHWLDERIENLEKQIQWDNLRLKRFKEMKTYYENIDMYQKSIREIYVENHYSIYTLGKQKDSQLDFDFIQQLVELFPFTYIAIKIPNFSFKSKESYVESSLGLGMLQHNVDLFNIDITQFSHHIKYTQGVALLLEVENPLKIKKELFQPLLNYSNINNFLEINNDLYGRLYFVDKTNNKPRYVLSITCAK